MENGAAMMEGGASGINMFVMAGYTALMDQMKNLMCVHYGNVQRACGSAVIIYVSMTNIFVMQIPVHL